MSISFYQSDQGSSSNPMTDPTNQEVVQVNDVEEGDKDQLHDDTDLEILAENQQKEKEEADDAKPEGAYKKKSRAKKSFVWDHMVDVSEADGTVKKENGRRPQQRARTADKRG